MLLQPLLAKDPKKRPNINQIFKFPLIKKTVPKVVGWETFKDEFTHTVLHGRDVFAKMKVDEKPKEGKKGAIDEPELARLKTDIFKPKGLTREQFDSVFNKYLEHLNNGHGKPGKAVNAHDAGEMTTIGEAPEKEEDKLDETTQPTD